jgi:hypothetical protein
MRLDRIRIALFVTLLLGIAATSALAEEGWKIKARSTEEDGEQSTIHITLGAEHIKVQVDGESNEAIIGPEGVTTIDHRRKQVMTITYDQMKSMASQFEQMAGAQGAIADAMQQAMAKMNPEDRAEAEKYMKDFKIPGMAQPEAEAEDEFEIKAAGEDGTVAGLDVTKYVVLKNGERNGTVWLTEAIDVGAIVANIARLAEIAPESMRSESADLDLLRHMTGFPAKMEDDEGIRFEILEAEQVELTAGSWEAPDGYRSPMGMAPGGG